MKCINRNVECINPSRCGVLRACIKQDENQSNYFSDTESNPPYEVISFAAGFASGIASEPESGGGSFGGGGSSSSWSDSSDSSSSSSDNGSCGGGD